ncbi:MAG: rhomboid family intramembrane serine protease [Candidatus Obscuribacterales bacterium]|nr:rhomboid family intramembrane serine protease [Candidatus Obscuribacterales bacterium]
MTAPQDPWSNQNQESPDEDSEQKNRRPSGPEPDYLGQRQYQAPRLRNQNYQPQQSSGQQHPGAQQQESPGPQPPGAHPQQGAGPQHPGAHPQPGPGPQHPGSYPQQGPGPQHPGSYPQQGPGPQHPGAHPQQGPAPQYQQDAQDPHLQPGEEPGAQAVIHQDHSHLSHAAETLHSTQSPAGPAAAYSDQLLAMWVDWNNKALVTKAILVANVVLFILMVIASGGAELTNPTSAFLIQWGANAGAYTLDGDYWRIVSAAFLHGSFLHIAMNMAVLWDVGPLVERIYGSKRFFIMYLFAAITASLNTLFWNPGGVSVGASGAVFGIFGVLLAFYQSHRKTIPAHVIKEKSRVVMAVIGYNLIFGMIQPNIDNAGHVGGLIGGFLIGFIFSPHQPLQRRLRFIEVLGFAVSAALCFGLWHVDKQVPMDKAGSFAIQSALRAHAAGKRPEALKFLDKYIDEVKGAEPAARLMRAEILMDDRSKLGEAMKDIDAVLQANPASAHGNQMKAYLLLRQGKPDEAITYTQRGLQNAGDNALGLLLIQGEALITTNRFREAIETLSSALKVDPDFGAAYAMRGICYRQLQQNDFAKADFDKAIQFGATGPEVYRGRGLINFLNGKYEEAAADYRKAIDAGDDNSSQYGFSFILKYFAELKSGNEAQAQQTLLAGLSKVDKTLWAAKIMEFLLGDKSAVMLEKEAKDLGQLSEAKTYIGLSFWSKGRSDLANAYFSWVLAHAPKDYIEYEIARKLSTQN